MEVKSADNENDELLRVGRHCHSKKMTNVFALNQQAIAAERCNLHCVGIAVLSSRATRK